MSIEQVIIGHLLNSEDYAKRVLPYLKLDYFEDPAQKRIVELTGQYVEKYSKTPNAEVLMVLVDRIKGLSEDDYSGVEKLLSEVEADKSTDQDWLLEATEKFCKDRDLENMIHQSILIMEGKDKVHTRDALPDLFSKSLAISFDTSIGHDYLEDAEERLQHYHSVTERIPFDLDMLNLITQGGLPRKSLTVLMATTGAGKSLAMCHMAASAMMFGKQVLYISLEMSEMELAKRIDSNLMNVDITELADMDAQEYMTKAKGLAKKSTGKLIFKEYPTGSAHAGHFRFLLSELKNKKGFVPDIIFVDYINICASSRVKNSQANSYTIVKSITEELRGLAMEFDVPMVSATQLNRGAYGSSDADLTDTSESIGLAYTVDAAFALISSEELESQGKLLVKQLKNRWGSITTNGKFCIGIEKSKMRLYNLESPSDLPQMQSRKLGNNSKPALEKPAEPATSGFSFGGTKKKLFDVFGEDE